MNSHHLPRYDIKYLERQKKKLFNQKHVYIYHFGQWVILPFNCLHTNGGRGLRLSDFTLM